MKQWMIGRFRKARTLCAALMLFALTGLGAQALRDEVLVEGGTFTMGSENGFKSEKPLHTVKVTGFWIMRTEVTQAAWTALMDKNDSQNRGDDLPVENVSWIAAIEYANRLSAKDGLPPAYSVKGNQIICDFGKKGWRLPTEAEWEYAAVGGARGVEASEVFRYSGSNDVEAIAWYSGNSSGTSHPVGQKAPNGLGIYDMSGNVCEWCWDWIGDYSAGTKTDPKGPSSGSSRIYRGGGWPHKDIYMRITDRHGMFPSWRTGYIGFRLARSQS